MKVKCAKCGRVCTFVIQRTKITSEYSPILNREYYTVHGFGKYVCECGFENGGCFTKDITDSDIRLILESGGNNETRK